MLERHESLFVTGISVGRNLFISELILRYRYIYFLDYSNLLHLLIESQGTTDRENKERRIISGSNKCKVEDNG